MVSMTGSEDCFFVSQKQVQRPVHEQPVRAGDSGEGGGRRREGHTVVLQHVLRGECLEHVLRGESM